MNAMTTSDGHSAYEKACFLAGATVFVGGDEEKEPPSFGIFADNDYFCNRFRKSDSEETNIRVKRRI